MVNTLFHRVAPVAMSKILWSIMNQSIWFCIHFDMSKWMHHSR